MNRAPAEKRRLFAGPYLRGDEQDMVLPADLLNRARAMAGKVTDSAGRSLPDAYIENLRTHAHAHTNEAGYFLLTATRAVMQNLFNTTS